MIIPIGVSEQEWFDFTTLDLSSYGQLPRYSGDWRESASSWMLNSQIAQLNIPRPEIFSTFQEWAFRFNQTVFG